MRNLLVFVMFVLSAPGALADIYKCQNRTTGEIEFRDSPCTGEQTEKAIPAVIDKKSAVRRSDESLALQAIVSQDRVRFHEVCEEKLDAGLTAAQFEQQCEAALQRQAECKIKASRMMPAKVHTAYMRSMAQGMSQDAAATEARKKEHWGGASPEEARVMMMPVAEFTSDCIRGVFR
jgi:hypothetical protein